MRKKRVGGEKSTPYLARMSPFDRIATSITALASGAEPSLEVLSAQAGMSPAHFQRTFRRLAGVSPLRFSQVMKVEVAREALLRSKSVLDAAWDAGLSGPGRLHDAMLSIERMTPGELKLGLTLRWAELRSAPSPSPSARVGCAAPTSVDSRRCRLGGPARSSWRTVAD